MVWGSLECLDSILFDNDISNAGIRSNWEWRKLLSKGGKDGNESRIR